LGRLILGLEGHLHVAVTELLKSLCDDAQIVLREPVFELPARNVDEEARVPKIDEDRGAKPRGEAMTIELRLEAGEDLIPEVHRGV